VKKNESRGKGEGGKGLGRDRVKKKGKEIWERKRGRVKEKEER
jgi:hypothetical protein